MYLIQGTFVTEDVTKEQFACNLDACKGACCWEGDFGAPLERAELAELDAAYPAVKANMTPAGIAAVEAQGKYTDNSETQGYDTTLVDGGACAYMAKTPGGMAYCAIEKTYNEGKIAWKKPISCHLYPIRVASKPEVNFEALNYDVWDICSAACTKGAREKIRVYEFAKPALIRKYGEEWYAELAAAVAAAEQ